MKVLVSLLVFAVTVASIYATCLHCDHRQADHQEIKYEDLIYLEYSNQENQSNDKSKKLAEQFINIQKVIQKYPLYAKEAQKYVQFSDPLILVDTTEFLANGEIHYNNSYIYGLENSILKEVTFEGIGKNLFSVYAILKEAEVTGDYVVSSNNKRESGQFLITLKDVQFKANYILDQFLEIRPEIYAKSITFKRHESLYTNEEVLKELEHVNVEVTKPYAYYYNYLNEVIMDRLANEMTVSFMPLIAKHFERVLRPSVLFPTKHMEVPKTSVNIAPGVQATIFNTVLNDLWSTNQIQKMINYTINPASTEFLFSYSLFDLRGTTKWGLEYNTGNTYQGTATFGADNIQTIIVVTKSNEQEKMIIKFIKTIVNGLTMILNTDDNCETIRRFAYERIPKVVEQNLETFFSEKSDAVLRKQIAFIGEKYQN